jgi:hypothetical protein
MLTRHSLTCLFVALAAVASGCGGSTKTVTTNVSTGTPATSAPAVASVPAGASSHTASQSKEASAPKATTAEPQEQTHQPNAPEGKGAKPGKAANPSAETGAIKVPKARQYGSYLSDTFITACQEAKGSHAGCACVVAEQELHYKIKGRSVAELLALELALQKGTSFAQAAARSVPLPKGVQQSLELCKGRK